MSGARRLAGATVVSAAAMAAFAAAPVFAEGAKFQKAPEGVVYSDSAPQYLEETIEVERPVSRSVTQPFAVLRGLDKVSGRVTDIHVQVGETIAYERLTITVSDCRTPPEDQAEDAFAFLEIRDARRDDGTAFFSGWMFASSPALSAMDHQRYDLWVLSCATS